MSDNQSDKIERSIVIRSQAPIVYRLVSRPGWWINNGTIAENRIHTEGGVSTVTHAEYGEFRIRTESEEPPHYISFRWMAGESHRDSHEGAAGTLIEFFLQEHTDGVILKVRESGFTSLPGTTEERLKNYRDNETGWESELLAAKTYVEAV